MPDRSWKACERRLAALFGAKRTGAHGDTSFDFLASEEYTVEGRLLGVEVKHRKDIPKWLQDDMEQTKGHRVTVKNRETDPVLILVPKGRRTCRALVVLEIDDFIRLRARAADRPLPGLTITESKRQEVLPFLHGLEDSDNEVF